MDNNNTDDFIVVVVLEVTGGRLDSGDTNSTTYLEPAYLVPGTGNW